MPRKLLAFAPNYSHRIRIRYRMGMDICTTIIRPLNDKSNQAVQAFWELLKLVKASLEPNDVTAPLSFLTAQSCTENKDIFQGMEILPALDGVTAVGSMTSLMRASLLSFVGTAEDGTRSVLYIPGIAIKPGDSTGMSNWRYESEEIASWGDIRDALTVLEANLTTRSRAPFVYNNYINVSVWRKKIVSYRK